MYQSNNPNRCTPKSIMMSVTLALFFSVQGALAFSPFQPVATKQLSNVHRNYEGTGSTRLYETTSSESTNDAAPPAEEQEEEALDYDVPEDAVVMIKPKAMKRLRELKVKQNDDELILRMGVRNGGCSGLSYVMDFSTADAIEEDDAVDEYPNEKIKCVVDAKSMLYLYGLELDYSEELIGGGFKFFNPNAEESCGCGSSFGV